MIWYCYPILLLDNEYDSENVFKEQEATDSNYNKDCPDDKYVGYIPVHSKLTKEKLLNYENIKDDNESDKNEKNWKIKNKGRDNSICI